MNTLREAFSDAALRPLMVAATAIVLIVSASWGVVFLWPRSPGFIPRLDGSARLGALLMVGAALLFYVLAGLGVLLRHRWGYVLFRFLLFLHLFVGFPATTYFAYCGLVYMSLSGYSSPWRWRFSSSPTCCQCCSADAAR